MRKVSQVLATIESWSYENMTPGVATFFSAIALSNLEGKSIRLSAEMQRTLLGFNVFGKKSIVVKDNTVCVSVKVCFGLDSNSVTVNSARLEQYLRDQKQINP